MNDNNENKNTRIRLQIPSNPEYVSLARDLIYKTCLKHNFPLDRAFEMKLICGEAINNVITHAYGGERDRPIFIEIIPSEEFIEIHCIDFGEQKAITASQARDMSDYRTGGLGLFLISKLSDYHYFDQDRKAGTRLILKKRVK